MGIKIFCAYLIGCVTGGVISYYILRDKFDNDLFEEVKKVKENVEASDKKDPVKDICEPKERREDALKEDDKVYDKIVKKQIKHYENFSKKYKSKQKTKPAADMDKLTKKDMLDMYEDRLADETFDDEEDDDDNDMIYEEDDIFPSEKRPEPYSVDPQGKTASYSSYDKITLIWYSKDDILVFEDSDEEFIHPEDEIGEKWRKCVGQFEPDMAYIRNDNTETDYEIVREDRRYS